MKLWGAIWSYAGGLLLIFSSLFFAYLHGVSITEDKWIAKWSVRDTNDQRAAVTAEAAERDKEQARQQSINKAIQSGQKIIDMAVANAASDRNSSNSLRRKIDQLTGQLSSSEASRNTCTTNASEAATHAALVLADVLKRADHRAGELAETADQARARGLICEMAYVLLMENQ